MVPGGSPSRPLVHLTARRGWVNDPLSPTWDGRRYHLWFQYVPDATTWAPTCHWGHAVSDDLLHWEERGVALRPDAEDGGVWSGCVVPREGGYRAFYTAVDVADPAVGRVRWADTDDLDAGEWTKGDVVVRAPEGLGVTSFRDPFVHRDGDGWRMLVGTALADGTAAATAYSSPDLDRWTHEGLAASRPSSETDPVWTGSLWECPQLQPLDGRHLLVTSVWDADELHHVAAAVGTTSGPTFVPASWHRLTAGSSYYAPATFRDADGELCIVFWMRGLLDEDAGRAGALSVPHRLVLLDGRPALRLHPAVTEAATAGPTAGVVLVVEPGDVGAEPLRLLSRGVERVRVGHDGAAVVVEVDGDRLRLDGSAHGVQVLVDGPCVEVLTTGTSWAHTFAGDLSWEVEGVPAGDVRGLA